MSSRSARSWILQKKWKNITERDMLLEWSIQLFCLLAGESIYHQKHTAPRGQRHPKLVIEEWPVMYEALTNELVKGLLEKVNEASRRGMKFVGFIMRPHPHSKSCNSTNAFTGGDVDIETTKRRQEHSSQNADESSRNWAEGAPSGQPCESRETQQETAHLQDSAFQFAREESPLKLQKTEGNKMYAVFNVYEDDSTYWTYLEGHLSVKVTRKGTTISTLEADWLELITFYYKQGLSLIDSFMYWETSKGDHLPKSLEGLFIYEDEGSGVPGSNRKGNDAIVVEQWTVIEGCEIKTDYGPLLHALAEFGWLLTCVLPTPIIRQDREGNLATKQVVFLQRPVIITSASQTPEGNCNFLPGLLSIIFQRWADKGLQYLFHLFTEEGRLASFSDLQRTFDLPYADFFAYYQITHYVNSLPADTLRIVERSSTNSLVYLHNKWYLFAFIMRVCMILNLVLIWRCRPLLGRRTFIAL
uniref:Raftlin-2 isoform X3 n=1 Tax=Geotrypetes seraphini TaxID=260995 RepID=A0A6P8QWH7_GEOSA|nr:raftlin-2 isoform X3 [Geotrypetes seraphini]